MLSSFACSWPWFFGGAIGGWLLWQLFDRLFRRDGEAAGMRLRRDLETVNGRVGGLQADVTKSQGTISTLRGELDSSSAALKGKHDEITALTADIDAWKSKHADVESKFTAAGVAATAAAAAAAAALTSAQDNHATTSAELTAANASLKAATEKHDKLKAEFDGVNGSLRIMTDKHDKMKVEVESVNGSLKTAYEQIAAHKKELETSAAALKAKTDDATRLATELAECRAKRTSVEDEMKSAGLAAAAAAAAAATAAAAAKSASDDRYAALQRDLSAANERYTKLKLEHDAAAAAAAASNERYTKLKADFDAGSAAASAANERYTKLKADFDAGSAAASAANDRYTKLKAEFDASSAATAAANDRYAKLKVESDALAAQLKAKSDEAGRVSAEAADWKRRHAEVETKMRDAGAAATAAAAVAATAAAAALAGANDRYGKLKVEFDASVATSNDRYGKLKIEYDALAAKYAAELEDWKRRSALAQAEIEKASRPSAGSFGFNPRRKDGKDDLLIIEGIGPKINQLLIDAGIDTFAKLASAPVLRVQEILDRAGPNFRLAKPASWAQQSELCDRGEWAALKKLQDELTAGVDLNTPSA